ncbi:TPA: glycosyltransferase, partial [Mannheimia haemolytica]
VAVISSTIGRPELERAVLSVQNQTYPCKHYVFVDGEKYHQQAADILKNFPSVIVTYLPMNTRADGWVNSSINAIAPFLVKEDIICYLDDDNWFEPTHVESGVHALLEMQSDYAYSLRNFYDLDGEFLCIDTIESLGEYNCVYQEPLECNYQLGGVKGVLSINLNDCQHIDTNCYFIRSEIARLISTAWYTGIHNDRNVYKKLQELALKGNCTKKVTVNYTLDTRKYYGSVFNELLEEPFLLSEYDAYQFTNEVIKFHSEESLKAWGGCLIWEQNNGS